ncbi:MAG: YcgN family cysteine cluster protein, partial [Hyphomonadaceae bacterium]
TLAEMTEAEWESLCDGCGKCCLISIEDEDSGDIYWTDVACKLFSASTCQCSDYPNRAKRVKDCVKLTPENVGELGWMPKTCAYRLIHEGSDLFWWHPLVSGDRQSVHEAGASVRGKTRPEGRLNVRQLVRRITEWPAPAPEPAPPKSARPKSAAQEPQPAKRRRRRAAD